MNQESNSSFDFMNTVKQAFSSPDQNTRMKHEEILTNFMQIQPDQFALLCIEVFSNEEISCDMRTMSSTVLKLAIKPTHGNENMSIWPTVSSDTKERIKECGLINLVDNKKKNQDCSCCFNSRRIRYGLFA